MPIKRYEMTDSQWEQIKDLFPIAKTERLDKDNQIMFNGILWIARSGTAPGKPFTFVFANGVMTIPCYSFL